MAIVPRHPTQLYMAVAEFITAALLLRFESRWRSQRGRLFFTWLALHGFWRLVIGFWRDDYSGPTFGIFNIASIVSALLLTVALIGLWRSPRATTSRRIDNQVL
jgi:phosphatidylglycerol:prolipoprotein diacylglycerol transferase